LKEFAHISASSVDHALSVLQQYGPEAHLMAGGQDLLFRIKKYIVQPACIVDLKTIPGMSSITFAPEGSLRIGSLATLAEIASSPDIRKHYTALAEATGAVASPQIRNMGTIGGNLCQDVWCWYLQDGFSCWKSGGTFCDLAAGDSRYYGSIMGGHLCLSNHPSDAAPALAALDAWIHLTSPKGKRRIPILEFFQGHQWVGNRLQSHQLRPEEVVTEIEIPLKPTRSTFLKFAPRKSWDFAMASVAASVVIEQGICKDVRIVLGGIATHPYRSREAEALLKGNRIDDALAGEAGRVALQQARPLKMNHYKVDLSQVLVRRALQAITP
jgi:xanthine dehydrogenase YagS FAD-binding subunit